MWDKNAYVQDEVAALEAYILEKFPQEGGFLDVASKNVINSGGKRLRPVLAILSAMFGDYSRAKVFPVAAALETLHTATLVHDDIIDNAETRRGHPSVSAKHGINMAVYTGDYLLVKAVMLLAEAGLPADKMKEVAKALQAICLGEVEQYLGRHRVPTPREYLKRIMRKTGILLSASCALGAFATGCTDEQIKLLGRFGMYYGAAFQIRDDLLDIESTNASDPAVGKPIINDLKEGIITIPVIYAVRRDEALRQQVKDFLEGAGDARNIVASVLKVGGAKEARRLKDRYVDKCLQLLEKLPATDHRLALEEGVRWLSVEPQSISA